MDSDLNPHGMVEKSVEGQVEPRTRDRLVMAALELFAEQGYEATGLKEILAKAEANSGSLYYYFSSKAKLLSAVLDKYIDLLDPVIMQPAFSTAKGPIERIFAVLKAYRGFLMDSECRVACPLAMLALEVGGERIDIEQTVIDKIAENFNNWCRVIESCLDEAADQLPAGTDRKALAHFVLTVMEGGMMQARVYRNVEHFDGSVAQLRDYMSRLLSDAKKQKTDAE